MKAKLISKILLVITAHLLVVYVLRHIFHSIPPTPLMFDGYWAEEDSTVEQYKIKVNNSVLEDLKHRLSSTKLPQSLKGTKSTYGFHSDYMIEVLDYWKIKYNWRKYEAILNGLPQYITRIEGIQIHFVRVVPAHNKAQSNPLLMLHGWPGSVWEFYKIVPLLTNPADGQPLFEVILASIPGFALSETPHKPGFDVTDAARVFYKLMQRLNHSRFFIHAEDWGTHVTTIMAQAYPKHVSGIHLTMAAPPSLSWRYLAENILFAFWPSWFLTEEEKLYYPTILEYISWMLEETGFAHLHATKPDTVAYGLIDSPVGLAAYMLEKFLTARGNPDRFCVNDCLSTEYSLDEVLTNVMIYWISGSMATAVRHNKEHINSDKFIQWLGFPITVPSGFAIFPVDLCKPVKYMVSQQYVNIVHYKNLPSGGHFAAFENPDVIAEEIKEFVRKTDSLS